ncbi:MAG: hypothetical protein K2G85_09885 [Muribaculaceae bacterium]|nr:hypothetical protein [Muribaculaceae bacterium]
MKNFNALKILVLLLLMVFTTQTTKAVNVEEVSVYLNDGNEGLKRDLYRNLSNAYLPHSDSIKGKCFFSFVITEEGDIDVKTIKMLRKTPSLPDEYVNAAEEAIKHLGKFTPSKRFNYEEQKWKPLRAYFNICVIFPIPTKN